MTYGDKYLQLYNEYISAQANYIGELRLREALQMDLDKLNIMSKECKEKCHTLITFIEDMKKNETAMTDKYLPES
jgi:hypothetical protein